MSSKILLRVWRTGWVSRDWKWLQIWQWLCSRK